MEKKRVSGETKFFIVLVFIIGSLIFVSILASVQNGKPIERPSGKTTNADFNRNMGNQKFRIGK